MKRATVGCNNEIFSPSEETLPQSMVSSVFPATEKAWGGGQRIWESLGFSWEIRAGAYFIRECHIG